MIIYWVIVVVCILRNKSDEEKSIYWCLSYKALKVDWRYLVTNQVISHQVITGEQGKKYSYFQIGSQFGSASPWRVGTCRWRVDGDRRLSYWLNFAVAVRRIEWRLDCVNVRPALSQWERRWSLSSTWNYVSTRKQQNTLQLTTIKKMAVLWNFAGPFQTPWFGILRRRADRENK